MNKIKLVLCMLSILLVLQPLSALAAQTSQPYASSIKIVNNASPTLDTVTVTDLNVGDLVTVYVDASTTATLGTGTVVTGTSTVVISLAANLGLLAGTVHVTVTSGANTESRRTSKNYAAEPSTSFLDPAQITITNNPVGTSDVVNIVNLNVGDVIKVYATATGTLTIAPAESVATGQTTISISIAQIGTSAGSLYVTVTTSPTSESIRTYKSYAAESLTTLLATSDISVTNNATGYSDTVVVRNLLPADIVRVYRNKVDTAVLKEETVATGQTTATLIIDQLGVTSGSIYVTSKRGNNGESTRTAKSYVSESSSNAPINNMEVINNFTGTSDIITIDNLNPTDIIKIYSSKTAALPISITTAGKNLIPDFANWTLHEKASIISPTALRLTATAAGQLSFYDVPVIALQAYAFTMGNSNAGTVNIRTLDASKNVIATKLTTTILNPTATFTTETNAAYIRVELTSTAAGTFNWINGQIELGSAVTAYESQALATTKNLIPPFSKWTVLHANTGISSPYNLKLTASAALQTSYVRVRVLPSTQYTYSLTTNGLVSITSYTSSLVATITGHVTASSAQSGKFTTPADAAYVQFFVSNGVTGTFTFQNPQLELGGVATEFEEITTPLVTATIKIPQLGTTAGSIYVTTTTHGALESRRIVKSYLAETPTTALSQNSIKIANNKAGTNDSITVYGLETGDIVTVYSTKIDNTVLRTATVLTGSTVGSISLDQLGTTAGSVYITVKTAGKSESIRVAKSYLAE